MTTRHYSIFDKICLGFDQALRALSDTSKTTGRETPAINLNESLSPEQKKQSAALMRINHAGEICAQALYHGQAMVAKTEAVQQQMEQSAVEEGDHLAWCRQRLNELGSHTSYLNPLWYTGSFCIGMVAGMIGDKWSLGFIVETERQVIKHLQGHLHLLARQDETSYRILQQMETDEAHHRDQAILAGAHELPDIIKKGMAMTAKIMVNTAYYI